MKKVLASLLILLLCTACGQSPVPPFVLPLMPLVLPESGVLPEERPEEPLSLSYDRERPLPDANPGPRHIYVALCEEDYMAAPPSRVWDRTAGEYVWCNCNVLWNGGSTAGLVQKGNLYYDPAALFTRDPAEDELLLSGYGFAGVREAMTAYRIPLSDAETPKQALELLFGQFLEAVSQPNEERQYRITQVLDTQCTLYDRPERQGCGPVGYACDGVRWYLNELQWVTGCAARFRCEGSLWAFDRGEAEQAELPFGLLEREADAWVFYPWEGAVAQSGKLPGVFGLPTGETATAGSDW